MGRNNNVGDCMTGVHCRGYWGFRFGNFCVGREVWAAVVFETTTEYSGWSYDDLNLTILLAIICSIRRSLLLLQPEYENLNTIVSIEDIEYTSTMMSEVNLSVPRIRSRDLIASKHPRQLGSLTVDGHPRFYYLDMSQLRQM